MLIGDQAEAERHGLQRGESFVDLAAGRSRGQLVVHDVSTGFDAGGNEGVVGAAAIVGEVRIGPVGDD